MAPSLRLIVTAACVPAPGAGYALDDLTAYQMNLYMGLAMLAVSLPAVLLTEGTLRVPTTHLPVAVSVGVLIGVGFAATLGGVALLSYRL